MALIIKIGFAGKYNNRGQKINGAVKGDFELGIKENGCQQWDH